MCTLIPFLNHRSSETINARKVLRAYVTNLGQQGSRSESKETDGATRSRFPANRKTLHKADGQIIEKTVKAQSLGSSGNKGEN